MDAGDAEGCIVVPLHDGEEVEVSRSDLPDNVADVIAMLRKEQVPLRLWIEFGVRGRVALHASPLLPVVGQLVRL
jgi:hypothetical protein